MPLVEGFGDEVIIGAVSLFACVFGWLWLQTDRGERSPAGVERERGERDHLNDPPDAVQEHVPPRGEIERDHIRDPFPPAPRGERDHVGDPFPPAPRGERDRVGDPFPPAPPAYAAHAEPSAPPEESPPPFAAEDEGSRGGAPSEAEAKVDAAHVPSAFGSAENEGKGADEEGSKAPNDDLKDNDIPSAFGSPAEEKSASSGQESSAASSEGGEIPSAFEAKSDSPSERERLLTVRVIQPAATRAFADLPRTTTVAELKRLAFPAAVGRGARVTLIHRGRRVPDHHTLAYYPAEGAGGSISFHAAVAEVNVDQGGGGGALGAQGGVGGNQAISDDMLTEYIGVAGGGMFGLFIAVFWYLWIVHGSSMVPPLTLFLGTLLTGSYVYLVGPYLYRTASRSLGRR